MTQPQAGYRDWRSTIETVNGARYEIATKPGVFSNGRADPAAQLLAECAVVTSGETAVHLNCGNALFGVVAAASAGHVYLTDRHVVSHAAALRSIALNGVTNATALLGHGTFVLPKDVTADVVGIRIPHEKQSLLQLLHDAFQVLRVGGKCYLAGANNEGIKSAQKTVHDIFGNGVKLAERSSHRVILATKRSENAAVSEVFENPFLEGDAFMELPAKLRGISVMLYSRPGVFSWDHVDEATAILADTMQVAAGESVLDLGCGTGALGTVAASLSKTGRVRLVDADNEAVRSSRGTLETAGLRNATVTISDVGEAVLTERFDVVVTNPPFHVGKATDLSLPLQFIRDAHDVLTADGRLYLVANRTLPYESMIAEQFGNVSTLHDGPRFKVLHAVRRRSV
jgi:16S rRNA (guanine1207-N2)-methyltransferase